MVESVTYHGNGDRDAVADEIVRRFRLGVSINGAKIMVCVPGGWFEMSPGWTLNRDASVPAWKRYSLTRAEEPKPLPTPHVGQLCVSNANPGKRFSVEFEARDLTEAQARAVAEAIGNAVTADVVNLTPKPEAPKRAGFDILGIPVYFGTPKPAVEAKAEAPKPIEAEVDREVLKRWMAGIETAFRYGVITYQERASLSVRVESRLLADKPEPRPAPDVVTFTRAEAEEIQAALGLANAILGAVEELLNVYNETDGRRRGSVSWLLDLSTSTFRLSRAYDAARKSAVARHQSARPPADTNVDTNQTPAPTAT